MTTLSRMRLLPFLAVAALLSLAPACSSDDGGGTSQPARDTGADATADTGSPDTASPDTAPDQTTADTTPDQTSPDTTPDTVADQVVDDVSDDAAEGGACDDDLDVLTEELGDLLGDAIAACGRSQFHCLACGLGNAALCGGVLDPDSDLYVDCNDLAVPDEECTLQRCIERCIEANDFGHCTSQNDCNALSATVRPATCDTTAEVCRNDGATAANEADLSVGCMACYIGITGCIVDAGSAQSCVEEGCECDRYQCDNDCPAEFAACSGLEPHIICSEVPAVCE